MSSSRSVNVPLVRVESSEDTTPPRKTGGDKILHSMSRWRQFVASPLLPLVVAGLLYSVILTDDLFGDEYAQYRWSVLGSSPYGSLLALDVNTQLAKIGYLLVGQPWAIRLHSILFSLGTIVLIWMVAKRCFDSGTAIIAAWLAALSPYLIEFAAEARPNAIFVFAGTLFLYALLLFLQNDSWPNTLLLMFSACFGLLARPMFVAILLFGLGYYIIRHRRITLRLALVSLAAIPFIILMFCQMAAFSRIGPKESSDVSASLLNFLLRLPMAFTYGYCTLDYPERDAGWNISIREVLVQNMMPVLISAIVFCAFLIGVVYLVRKVRSQTIFLIGAVVLPISILLAVQETGFSMLNEKHCAGFVGAYYVLLAAILVHICRFTWGKCTMLLYAYLVAVSLFHFYFRPEIYSRRSNFTALNSFLSGTLKNDDLLLGYRLSRERKPNYLTILEQADHIIDLYQDKPPDVSLPEYVASVDTACTGKIYLIYDSRLRPGIDPDNCVLSFMKKHRDFVVKHYGRNLLLYEFSQNAYGSERL